MATLTTGVMFLLFTFIHLLVWGILRRWSACAPNDNEVSTIAEISRNAGIKPSADYVSLAF
jgi:hypothetical protein